MSALPHIEEEDSPVGTEHVRVLSWRVERLIDAGYDGETALVIGLDERIDLHRAVSLLRAGCPPDTALRILI
jgi:hypothetical protein